MKKGNSIYVIAGGVFVLAVAAYFVITGKTREEKKIQRDALKNIIDPEIDMVVTGTGSTISNAQATLPKELAQIMKMPLKEVAAMIGNKNIYAKVDSVKARITPMVNNGFISNAWGVVSKDVLLGRIIAVADDKNKAKNADGRVYKWLKVELSVPAKESIMQNSDPRLPDNIGINIPAYFREDTIYIK